MSHVSKVELDITSLSELEAACVAMGFTFDRAATAWRCWYTTNKDWRENNSDPLAASRQGIARERYGVSDAGVIRIGSTARYDIGVYKKPGEEGRWILVYDSYDEGKGIEAAAGKGLVKLKERYGARIAAAQLRKKGFRVREEVDAVTHRLRVIGTRVGAA